MERPQPPPAVDALVTERSARETECRREQQPRACFQRLTGCCSPRLSVEHRGDAVFGTSLLTEEAKDSGGAVRGASGAWAPPVLCCMY